MDRPGKMTLWKCGACGHPKLVYGWPWLRYVRKNAGVGLREMSKKLCVSAAYLCDIELGRRRCPDRIGKHYEKFEKSPQEAQ